MGKKTNNTNDKNKKGMEEVYLDFTAVLYPQIAKRVKNARKKLGCPLDKFVIDKTSEYPWIDIHILSNIENGKAEKRRNPYLLSRAQISEISSKLGMTKEELVWGSSEEEERFARLIIVTVLCNSSDINPFCYYDSYKVLFDWAYNQVGLPEELNMYLACAIEYPYMTGEEICDTTEITPAGHPAVTAEDLKKKVNEFFENKYGFFYNKENYDAYEILKKGYSEDLKKLSDNLFMLVLHDCKLAEKYAGHVVLGVHNNYFESDTFIEEIEKCYNNPSRYIGLAMDGKKMDYCYFVSAFDKFWERKGKDFMQFFDKHFFKNDKVEEGLRYFRNEDFMAVIKSDEFLRICEEIRIIEEFAEQEAIMSHNIYRSFFLYAVQKYTDYQKIKNEKEKHDKSHYTLDNALDYLLKSVKATKDFAENQLISAE